MAVSVICLTCNSRPVNHTNRKRAVEALQYHVQGHKTGRALPRLELGQADAQVGIVDDKTNKLIGLAWNCEGALKFQRAAELIGLNIQV